MTAPSASASSQILTTLRAMADAPYTQPIGAWFGEINEAIAKAEAEMADRSDQTQSQARGQ